MFLKKNSNLKILSFIFLKKKKTKMAFFHVGVEKFTTSALNGVWV